MLKTQKETQTYSSVTGPMKKESSAFFGDYVEEIIPWANLHGLQVVTMVMVSLSKATHDQDSQPMRCVNWTANISTQHALCLQIKSVLWKQLRYVISGDWCCVDPFAFWFWAKGLMCRDHCEPSGHVCGLGITPITQFH